MTVRKAVISELDEIMEIYETARRFMREHDNSSQWINGYPWRDLVSEDIENGCCYVCTEGSEIAGVFAFVLGDDPTYAYIENGSWLNDEPYGTIHRLGSSGTHKGVAKTCFDYCKSVIKNVRADTHADNYPMQKAMEKNGFKECGIIYVEDGTPRKAYHYA